MDSIDHELTDKCKAFILNNGQDPASSDNPQKAIVSFKTDRGTSHKMFVDVLDALTAAYYEIYAQRAGVTVDRWREISSDPNADELIKAVIRQRPGSFTEWEVEIPKNISIAEPTKIGG